MRDEMWVWRMLGIITDDGRHFLMSPRALEHDPGDEDDGEYRAILRAVSEWAS